jgi:hypothetical protein
MESSVAGNGASSELSGEGAKQEAAPSNTPTAASPKRPHFLRIALGAALVVAAALVAVDNLGCVITTRATSCAPTGATIASDPLDAFPSECGLRDWIRLRTCGDGLQAPGCSEGYGHWFAAGCLCDHRHWPRRFLPPEATPIGQVWALMGTGRSYHDIAMASGCLERADECAAPTDGAVRLDSYGQGVAGRLEVMAAGQWRTAVGAVDDEAALALCEMLGTRRARLRLTVPLRPG